jgi:hypothetical protein
MSSAALPLGKPYEKPVPVPAKPRPDYISNAGHVRDNMPPRRTDELDDVVLREATHGAMLALTAMAKVQSVPQGNGKWTGWIQTGVVCGMLLVTGTNRFATGEADLKQELAIQKVKLEAQSAMISTTVDRMQSLEYVWANTRQQLAPLGIQINPKTGDVTIKRER